MFPKQARKHYAVLTVLAIIALMTVFRIPIHFVEAAPMRALPAGFKAVGYMPSWTGNVSDIQFSKLTHINYAFLIPNSDGSLQAIDNPSKLQSLVSSAHANGVKVLIAVGGWQNGNDSNFETLSSASGSITNFTNNIVNFVNSYGLDVQSPSEMDRIRVKAFRFFLPLMADEFVRG
jgi:chitinase